MLIFAIGVAGFAYGLQFWSAVYAYPIHSGGRPLNSWPIFLLVPFEVGILAAAIAGFAALLVLCGLPRVNHPLFDWDAVERATDDRYFLLVDAPPEISEGDRLRTVLARCPRDPHSRDGAVRPAVLLLAAVAFSGCSDQSMTRQAALRAEQSRADFRQRVVRANAARRAVSQESLAYATASAEPPPADMALLRRGKERFEIFCAPCHGFEGDGNGAIVRRGFPRPPSYYEPMLMAAPASSSSTPSPMVLASCIPTPRAFPRMIAGRLSPISARFSKAARCRSRRLRELEKAAPLEEDSR